ncbi:class I SAM-dependent methyltransferase [Octadecabacter sp. 1_MG-2023]|uniref:class I SAM-dependent DNA methyltransferase n=1 Tax=unclassified Octadecabacter TaxID=196158 RepID=UPI001C0A206B|nr:MULTISPECIES: class I SAM-dependent methyltransferase [unclassified Octadecabacter]MBU2992598.1 class I SAM-dependent methyltransferase [Octadecabacter sp. B2R22]MDO6734645.1 class I SAM-dependent methyltransferase [Octadecabacter sp. 1_MG-2023]
MTDPKTIAFYDGAADNYDKCFDSGSSSKSLQDFLSLLPDGGDILDLGCGPARASVHMRAAGFNPDPVDASDGMIELANEAHNIGARKLTFDELDMVAAYDGVWANFSLLHAPKPDLPKHFSAIASALRDGGVFHVAMKVGTGEKRDHIDRLYTFVTVDELQQLLRDAGFEVLGFEEGREAGMAGTIDPFVNMRARKIA